MVRQQATLSARGTSRTVLTRVDLGRTEDVDETPLEAWPSEGFEFPTGEWGWDPPITHAEPPGLQLEVVP
jgi:hypothetical protein